jgi:hypothetical protein
MEGLKFNKMENTVKDLKVLYGWDSLYLYNTFLF